VSMDDPNREAVGLAPIWTGAGDPPPEGKAKAAPKAKDPEPEAKAEPKSKAKTEGE